MLRTHPTYKPYCVLVLALIFPSLAGPQTGGSVEPAPEAAASSAADDYTIGPGDVLSVFIVEEADLGGKFRVSETGSLEIPALPAPIRAEGQTPVELAHTIRQALIDAKQLRDPKVSVFVDQYHGRTVTVIGPVKKPSVYPLERRTTVLEALSLAGGLEPNAGNIVSIVRGRASAEATNTPPGSVQILDLSKLTKNGDVAANVEVRNGDVISVSSAAVIYVVGAVTKPGGFAMLDQSSGVSVAQAVAMAQGLTHVAAGRSALIVRQSTSDVGHQQIPVDVYAVLTGKITDVQMAPNDILYIPESGAKKALKAMGEVAMAAANGIAVYGIGYRAAGVRP